MDADPGSGQLVHAVNESGQTRVPVTVSAHGTVLKGVLIAQEAYCAQLAEGSPFLGALQSASGLLGKKYAWNARPRRTVICTLAAQDQTGKYCDGSAWMRPMAGRWGPRARIARMTGHRFPVVALDRGPGGFGPAWRCRASRGTPGSGAAAGTRRYEHVAVEQQADAVLVSPDVSVRPARPCLTVRCWQAGHYDRGPQRVRRVPRTRPPRCAGQAAAAGRRCRCRLRAARDGRLGPSAVGRRYPSL